jgi:lambda repressor-like predicted transcriptional regulator
MYQTRLKTHLALIGMRQMDLAEKAGVHSCQINVACNRDVASPRVRAKIAAALGLEEKDLWPNGVKGNY